MIVRKENGIVIDVLAQPGSKVSCLQAVQDGRLKIRIAARAIDGAANQKLCEFLSKLFGISKSSVILLAGEKSRLKKIFLRGEPALLLATLEKSIVGACSINEVRDT